MKNENSNPETQKVITRIWITPSGDLVVSDMWSEIAAVLKEKVMEDVDADL